MSTHSVAPKVKASTLVSGVVAFITTLVGAHLLGSDVPEYVVALITTAVTAGATFLAGYIARHQARIIELPSVLQGPLHLVAEKLLEALEAQDQPREDPADES